MLDSPFDRRYSSVFIDYVCGDEYLAVENNVGI